MDRRDALKKLGMGGATMVGASAIMSAPVFADGGSTSSRPGTDAPTITLTRLNNDAASGSISIARLPCPFGTINPSRIDYGVSATTSSGTTFTGAVAAYSTAPTISPPPPFAAVSLPIGVAWGSTPRSVTITVAVRWVCREANSTNLAWSCGTWTRTITANSGGTLSPGAVQLVPNSSNCPVPT